MFLNRIKIGVFSKMLFSSAFASVFAFNSDGITIAPSDVMVCLIDSSLRGSGAQVKPEHPVNLVIVTYKPFLLRAGWQSHLQIREKVLLVYMIKSVRYRQYRELIGSLKSLVGCLAYCITAGDAPEHNRDPKEYG